MSRTEPTTADQRFRILVVDDDQEIGYMFQRLLGGPDVVSVARDGYEALDHITSTAYDLFFLDIKLPGMDGIETLASITSMRPDAVVVLMSGYTVEQELKKAIALGAHDFLSKPFENIDQIMAIKDAARYLSRHKLTVRRLARPGEYPALEIDEQWHAHKTVLDRWIKREAIRQSGQI